MRILILNVLVLVSFAASVASAENYCLAIRGNGELAPAHWGAIANVVERLGLPSAQAGGSSASISMFLLDAVATNKFVVGAADEVERRERAALLVKSFEGFAEFLMSTNQFKEFKLLYTQLQALRQTESLEQVLQMLQSPDAIRANEALIRSNLQTAMQIGLLNKKTLGNIQRSLNDILGVGDLKSRQSELGRVRFYVSELLASIRAVGSFDAATDANLFFRPGFVDFDVLAGQLGQIAQFYSARESAAGDDADWQKFFNQCTRASVGKQWPEIAGGGDGASGSGPASACRDHLNHLIGQYFSREHQNFSAELVGQSIRSFPTTAVLTTSAFDDASKAFRAYGAALNPEFGWSFRVQDPEAVRFGYWGDEGDLAQIRGALRTGDEKNRRFLALGRASWAEVLSLSPAEPGLSPLKPFTHGKISYFSAGGWSDLHPVNVLRAAGCANVVYVTRRGGESLFAQGVAKRLMSLDPQDLAGTDASYGRKWDMLRTKPEAEGLRNWIVNNQGDPRDVSSLWSRLYNMANPSSSIRQSLAGADAVLCTDWNSLAIKNGARALINDGYTAPYHVPASSGLGGAAALTPRLNVNEQHRDGYPKFVGCF